MRRHLLSFLFPFLLLSLWTGERAGWAGTSDALSLAGSTQMPFKLGGDTYAVWSGGAFVFIQDRFSGAPLFQFFDRNGKQISQFTFSIPGASLINIYDNSISLGLDGSLAIVGTAYSDDSRGGLFVAWVSQDRQEQTIIRTSPFFPHTVTIASDGTIWVAGDDTKKRHEESDFSQFLIRRYDKKGKLLGSFIPWASLRTDDPPFPPTVHSVLLPLKDRVGWYSPGSHTYIEFSLDGSVIDRLKSAPHPKEDITYVAVCSDGSLFASTRTGASDGHQTAWGIFTLDRQRGEWSLISRNEKWGMLFGCDGTRLASATDLKTISWLAPAAK
jgi:hypothetical protein